MVSKNNQYWKQQQDAQRVPHYGLRKLSIGVASVLLSTTLYMGVTAHADTVNSQGYKMLDSKVANNSNGDSVVDRGTNTTNSVNSANTTNTALGDSHEVVSTGETTAKNEANAKPQVTEVNNDNHMQSGTANANVNANVKLDVKTPSNEMFSAVATETSPVPMSPSASSSSQGAVTAPVESEASNKANSQAQPSSVTNTTQIKLSHRPVMRLAAATTTNSDELIVGKDVTISDFSVTAAEGKNEFENGYANIKFTMHTDDPSVLVGKRLTIQLDRNVWDGFYSSERQGSNPTTISYQGQVIGTLNYGYPYNFVYITFNNHVKDFTKISLQSDLVVADVSQTALPYQTSLYTSTKAKDGQIYHLADDVTIGQQKYSSNLPSVIHYRSLASQTISSVTDLTTTSYAQRNSELYAGTFYKTPNGIYYSQSSYSSGISNLYAKEQGQPGCLYSPNLYVGTDIITNHTQSYTATIDIDQTKLSLDRDSTLTPITSYSLTKNYWDDKYLLPNTSDVYFYFSRTSSSTTTADATVTKNGIIFNKLNGQSLSTQRLNIDSPTYNMSFADYTNYIDYGGKLYLTPALFKQLQAVAESDQNLTEAINTVKTTGMNAEIKLINPIDTGLKATIKTSDGKTKEVSLLIDTIDYQIVTVSTAPKGAILVAAQGKTVKVYHPGDQNIPSVVNQNKLTKTITRTINVHKPGEKVITIKQAVVLTQSVSVVDGKDVTYNGDWKVQGNSSWASYDAPVVPGYTASQPNVAKETVTGTTEDQTINITYTANDQSTQVVFVDDDDNGKTVGYKGIHGKTGETQKLTDLPENYELANGQSDTITFSPNTPVKTTVHLKHKIETKQLKIHTSLTLLRLIKSMYNISEVSQDNYLMWISNDEFNSEKYDGNSKDTGSVTGSVQYDLVSKKVVKVNNGETLKFGKTLLNYPSDDDVANGGSLTGSGDFLGHTFTQLMNEALKDNLSYKAYASANLTKDWLANKELLSDYFDGAKNVLVPFTFENGKQYGSDYEIDTSTIDNSFSIKFSDLGIMDSRFGGDEDRNGLLVSYISLVMPIVYQPYISKTVTRTINVTSPDKTVKTIKQTAEINQNVGGDIDSHQNGYLHKGDAYVTDNNWTAYTVPAIDGYTANKSQVEAVAVDGNTTDQTVNISYTANQQSVNINYIDVSDGNKVVHTTIVNGVTNGDSVVSNELPDGYKLVDVQSVPKTIHFNADNNDDINIKVQHSVVTVTPNSPKTPSDKLPDNPNKSYPSGVSENDLNKTTTRTIKVTTPDGQTKTVTQTAKLTRTADVDEVTGEVKYGDWSTGQWGAYEVPTVPGYTASQTSVTTTPVDESTKDQTVDISYTANDQTAHINYVDDADAGKIVHTTTITGKTGEMVNLSLTIPDKYQLADGQQLPTAYTFVADSGDVTIHLVHQVVQREATVDVQLGLAALVRIDDAEFPLVTTQNRWAQLDDNLRENSQISDKVFPSVEVGTVTGHVNYDLVDNKVVSFADDWTSLNSGGRIYQMPDGTEVVNGISVDSPGSYGKPFKEYLLKYHPDTDPDYANRPWHGYLSVNATNKEVSDLVGYSLQSGLVGNEPNALVKANGDQAATAVKSTNKTVDLSLLQRLGFEIRDLSEQNGQLQGIAELEVVGVYIPYVEKTATRTINVTTPDGKTTVVKQTATLAKQVDFSKNAHPAWTIGEWTSYDAPAIPGYTASQSQVAKETVTGETKDQTVNITYTANDQSTHVNYVDAQSKTIHTTTVNGKTGQTVKVSSEIPDGWKLADGQTVPSEITFDADGHEPIEVTVAHRHVTVDPDHPQTNGTKLPDNPAKTFNGVEANDLNKTITRTIKVTTPDGQTKTVEQAVHLTRTADVDEVTGEVTYSNWTTGEWASYDVPTIPGYTASQNEVPTAKVAGDTKDQTVTVTYTADQQNLIVNFIDDTTGQTLKTVNKDGLTNSNSNYNTKSDIQNYVNSHYRLVSDDTNGQNLVFDNDDSKTQTYNVHLAHNTHDIKDSNTVTETIHYKLDNGQKAFDDYNAQLSFTRTGYNDEVTGQNHWNDWQATKGQTFNAVQSPSKEGYTPDKTSIEAVSVKPGDKNIDITVTYNANAQTAKISYIDDTTGRILKIDNANGKFNQAISFDNNVDNQIQDYEQQGYVLKFNSFSNQAYQADNAKNVFEVHLIHGTKNVQRNDTINETVQYQMEDGTKAPVTNTQSVDFTQDGVQDLVTNNIDWKATAPHQFKEVITPVMTGYTPDIASVPATTVNFGDKDINKIVTYKANAQTAKISYIDDTTGAILKTDNANGKFNQAISFGDVDGAIKGFEDKGYQLKSNSFKDQKYQADNNSNVFEVHLVHGTKNVQRTQKITETINYQMDDGSEAPATNTQSVDFTQNGVQDLVTNNIDWKATEPQQFKAVDMPTVTGYTPDITNIPATTVNFGDKDINKLVTYKANAQNATINYIDDTTGKTIKTDNANGKFNQPISFDNNVDNQIKVFENQGYVLKSNSFNGQKYQADNDKNVFEVHLVHGTKNVQRTQKITETVNYQMDDGSQAPSTNTQSVNFTQNGVQDLVTKNIDWKATDPQQFKAVDTPTVTGYTPDIASVPVTTVNFGDKDINKTVTYKANPQSAKITYIDDNTGKALKVDDANGKFNQVIDFANMNSDIKDFENQGYVLKSNSFNGQKYQADNAKNTFEVHFTHGTKNVQRQDTITETVKYQYDNGTSAHENNVQTLNFTQDGVQDLVTKNIDWKPTDAQEFKQVDTPAIDGYTPDITSISATKVNLGDSDINKVVTYQANNQMANIYYVDDMTGSSISNSTANGKFGTVIDFGNVNDKINTFKSLGYQLVSNGFNGQTYQSDNSKNVYYVHFTHGIKNIQRNKQITETIKYQYENGQQAQPDSVQTVSFNENGSQDLVTKKINWFNDAPQQFKAVNTPTITGYTADIDNIPAVVVNYDNDNINKVVTYKANSQTAKINYIDDTTGKVIKTDTANGKFNQAISFSETPTNVVNDLIKRGYKLVSNSFNGQTYQNDNSKNGFTIHLVHNTKNVSKQNTVTRTINYLDNNGKAIQTPTVETVTFTQNGITDLVTGNTTWNTPSPQTFETVTSPTIKGFGKPDVEVVKPQTVNFNDQNVVVNVHYPKATTPTNVNDNTTTPTVDHDKGKLNPTTFTTTAHQTTPQAHTANNGGQQSITPQSINKPSEQQTVANNGTKANTLPQTGNSDDNSSAIVGLGLLSGMLGLLGIKGKKKQN